MWCIFVSWHIFFLFCASCLPSFGINRRIPTTVDADVLHRNAAIQPATEPAAQDTAGAGLNAVQLHRAITQQL